MKKSVLNNNAFQLVIAAVAIFVVMTVARPSSFLSFVNLKSMGIQIADVGFFTMGIAVTMIAGGIDLSVVSLANLTAVINAVLLKSNLTADSPVSHVYMMLGVCLFITIVIGIASGVVNGFLIATLRIPPILATLGTMNIFAGISVVITTGKGIIGFPDQLLFFGSGEAIGIPIPVIMLVFLSIGMYVIMHKTPYGLQAQYYGSNRTAAFFSGINTQRIVYITHIIAGILGSISGVLIMARTNSATVDYGSSIILYSLLAAVLGGVSPIGGKGNIMNVLLALIVMQLLNSGLNLIRVSSFLRETTPGILLILVMMFNHYAQVTRERKLNKKVLTQSTPESIATNGKTQN